MSDQLNPSTQDRLFYLDNLRIYLTITVILHHASLAYGGAGDWYGGMADPAVDAISAILLPIFNGINQSYFMSAFFLFSGYFTPRSCDQKGSIPFLKDRLIRLGIPILVYSTVIVNINLYLVDVYVRGNPGHVYIMYEPGHLWFLQALLFFAVIYAVFVADSIFMEKIVRVHRNTFPPDRTLILWIGILTVLTFTTRLIFPVGVWFLQVQPAHFMHYTFCFFAGVLAYRGGWFRQLPKATGRRWGIWSLVAIPFLAVIGALGGGFENPDQFMEHLSGGLHWESLAYAAWESFLMVGIIVFLLCFFREKLNSARPFTRTIAANVYTVYIIHATVLLTFQILFFSLGIPTIVKFITVSLLSVSLCFLLSSAIRKIPYAKRVLG